MDNRPHFYVLSIGILNKYVVKISLLNPLAMRLVSLIGLDLLVLKLALFNISLKCFRV